MIRAGLGFDAHPFAAEGRPLRLGGLDWPGERGLAGHSDGDVLLHAIADAVLGAARLGSLGERFPDTDPANRGRDSAQMLEMIGEMASPRFAVISLDATVVGEAPRVSPRRAELEARIAQLLSIDGDRISVKGTSSNGLGFPGKGEGLAALAVVLLEER
jgi:2-C-methyl-D-erythritol 2,4-cyclodiphosphate synthase